jgi:membrane-bound ClpP family serine protease
MQKVTNDIQASCGSHDPAGRNPEEAAKAVAESRSFSTTEAWRPD